MFVAELHKPERLLRIAYSQHVAAEEMGRCLEQITKLLAEIEPGFHALTDLSNLESMDFHCAPHSASMMELLRGKGFYLVVRVVPDPHKDIGLNILSLFHYG